MSMLSVKAAAGVAGVAPSTMRTWVRLGMVEGVCYTPGGHRRIPEESVRRLMALNTELRRIEDDEARRHRAGRPIDWMGVFLGGSGDSTTNIAKE